MKLGVFSLCVIIISLLAAPSCFAGSFFEGKDRYKGFYWFEQGDKKPKNKLVEYEMPSAEVAKMMIEERRSKMDEARDIMVAVGLDQNAPESAKREAIIAYKKLEMPMWDGAIAMSKASDMANVVNPALADNLKNPTNVFGVKLKRKVESEKNELAIRELAKDFDLILFEEGNCPYCQQFKPVIRDFATNYQFKLSSLTLASKEGLAAKQLGVSAVPTVIIVAKDGSSAFELSRGMVSQSELVNNTVLASQYTKEMSSNINKKFRGIKR